MIVREHSRKTHFHYYIDIKNLLFSSKLFPAGDHQPVRDVSKFGTGLMSACLTQITYGRVKVASN